MHGAAFEPRSQSTEMLYTLPFMLYSTLLHKNNKYIYIYICVYIYIYIRTLCYTVLYSALLYCLIPIEVSHKRPQTKCLPIPSRRNEPYKGSGLGFRF